ncbi:uncharacterized protein LOC105439578 [Strongylocentrotus purpuratus]|uniref:Uncharacterized protein n=1 Tax=Strongylocentrotus purpuratus TaxID=7668 RepID=A0A7M7NE87_STRPU|nr:uncharacterized protein LOC105439578 [Strongylocentrotus purpuratus]
MDERLQIFIYLIFIVSKTYEVSVSTRIQNPEILPVVGEDITLACIVVSPSKDRQLYWQYGNDSLLASDTCRGVGCRNEKNILDMSKYILRADSSSGNLTIMNLTVDDSGRYQCLVFTSSDAAASEIVLKVLLPVMPRLISITDNRSEDGYKNRASVSITSGRTLNLTCSVQDAIPPAEVEWDVPEEVQIQIDDQYNAIHVPPSDIRLTAYGSIHFNVTGTRSVIVFEDSATSFTCTSVGSRPTALIAWSVGSDDDLGITTSASTPNEDDQGLRDTKSTLLLIPKRRHHNNLLRCMAYAGMNQRQTEVRVIVYGPPDPPYLSGVEGLQDGVSSNVTCTSNNGYPAPAFQWYLGSKNVTKDYYTQSLRKRNHRLDSISLYNFTPTVDDHGKLIVCQVFQASAAPMEYWSISDVLHVLFLPTELQLSASSNITNLTGTETLVVFQDIPAFITCKCLGSRPVAILFWELGDPVVTDGITTSATPNRMDSSLFDAEITCIYNNGYPAPVFQWNLGTTDLTNKSATEKEPNGYNRMSARSVLMFTPKESNHGQYLVCEVFQPEAQPAWSRSIDARPRARIFEWFFNGSRLENDTKIAVYQWEFQETETVTTSTLMLSNPKVINEGKYECLVKTPLGNGSAAIYFSISRPPDTPRVRGINNLKSGSQSTLTCTSNNGYPTSLVHWYLGSENVTQYSSVQTELTYEQRVFTLSNLTFVPTRYNHGQLLVCEILHSAPPYSWTKNKTDVLNIAYSPSNITISVLRIYNHEQFLSVQFICTSDANPPARNFYWYRNGTILTNTTRHLIVAGRSSQMYTFFVDQTTSSTFFDAWLPGFDGGLQRTSSLKYCPKDAQAETEGCGFVTNITGTSYTLVGFYPFTWYRMTVWEVKSAGSSSQVEVVASTALIPDPPSWFFVDQNKTTPSTLFVAWEPRFNGGLEQTFTLQYCLNDTQEEGCGITTSWDKQEHILTLSEANQTLDEMCFITQRTYSGPDCASVNSSECIEPGTEVNIDPDDDTVLVTFGRELCSKPADILTG